MRVFLTGISFLILLGCSQKIVSYINTSATFDQFQTYRIVSPRLNNQANESALAYKHLVSNIEKAMTKRDYQKSSIVPDLTLRYELTASTNVETTTTRSPIYPVYRIDSRTIHQAIILLELTDQNKKLVWQGSYDLKQEKNEKKIEKVIEKAIEKIFTTYPYRALEKHPDPTLTNLKK